MATKLDKPVRREINLRLGQTRQPAPVEVTLTPGGWITFREKGKRKVYHGNLNVIFESVVIQQAWEDAGKGGK